MKPSDFIHPEDAAALRQMEGIPGFAALVKKVLIIGIENLQYGVNMASSIRLSEKQLHKITDCGAKLDGASKFCSNCGTKLG